MARAYFLTVVILVLVVIGCKYQEVEKSEIEKEIHSLLNEIVVELKSPKKISLTPRTFIELNAILMASNYFWIKEVIETNTNISSEVLDDYRTGKKRHFLSLFGVTLEEFETYSVNNYGALQEFTEKHPEIMSKYNALSQMLPTLFEDY